jgi:hypothetical protein
MTEEQYDKQTNYRNILPIEILYQKQIDRCMEAYTDNNWPRFESGVNAAMMLLPQELREIAITYMKDNQIQYCNTADGRNKYMQLFCEITRLLTKAGIIWHRASYPIGHD